MPLTDPRNIVGFEETAAPADLTFKIDNSTITYDATKARGADATMLDKAVTLSADDTVALAADGNAVIGKLLHVTADNKCSVRVHGFVSLPGGASATLTRGAAIVGALGAASAKGYVRIAASATAAELVLARGLIIDNADTTAVGILLV